MLNFLFFYDALCLFSDSAIQLNKLPQVYMEKKINTKNITCYKVWLPVFAHKRKKMQPPIPQKDTVLNSIFYKSGFQDKNYLEYYRIQAYLQRPVPMGCLMLHVVVLNYSNPELPVLSQLSVTDGINF